MSTLTLPAEVPALGIHARRAAPIIVATDGRAQSDSALMMGRIFAESPEALRVIKVLRPMPIIPESQMVVSEELEASRRAEIQREVIAQMDRTWGSLAQVELLM